VLLHNNTGGSTDNLSRTYAVQDTPALRAFFGRSIRGTWRLRVRDTARFDVGRLSSWRLAARLGAAVPAVAGPAPAGRSVATT
jgi:subtilisin-like proprotein convertase family protein